LRWEFEIIYTVQMWRQKRNKDFGIDWDRINLIPFCVLHRIENTNHFSDWLKSFSPPDSLGLNWFSLLFSPFLLPKIAICLFRWITKRKITTGERQDPRFLTRHAIRTGAHNKSWAKWAVWWTAHARSTGQKPS